MKWLWLILTAVWTILLFNGAGPLPALGPFFDIHSGIWAHKVVEMQSQNVPGLKNSVTITYDQNGVPHFFASNERDLYFAQGFVTASQRLFQMDITTRVTAGRLSELVGERTLPLDQFYVKMGMRDSAKATLKKYMEDPRTKMILEAYIDGVNRWIERMPELPAEYKLLGVRPQYMDVERIIHMAQALTFNLTGRTFDVQMSQILVALGGEGMLDLFPEFLPPEFDDFVFPGKMLGKRRAEHSEQFKFTPGLKQIPTFPWANPGQGSNNWAVAAKKSESGTTLFANDTHLGLYLPNIWFENQLSCPEFNVYGVSLASVPGIVNGMNPAVAWGPTNGTTDVLDLYEIQFENSSSFHYVTIDGRRQAVRKRELIYVKGGAPQSVEVVRTHLGYLIHREGKLGLVAGWTGQNTKNELKAIRSLYESKTAEQCIESFVDWNVPIQNFVCVDAQNIIWEHSGFTPLRNPGDGRVILDGRQETKSLIDKGAIPNRLRAKNPDQGFFLSANQKILPPGSPYYLGWDYEPPWRGKSIRRVLAGDKKLNAEDMIALQNNNLDIEAETILPTLLKNIDVSVLSVPQASAIQNLSRWDYVARAEGFQTTVFKVWLQKLKEALFDDDFVADKDKPLYPRDARVAWLLERVSNNPNDSDVKWVDNTTTPEIETLAQQVTVAFRQAWDELASERGNDYEKWSWRAQNRPHFGHVGRIPGFGTEILNMDGATDTIRGQSDKHGAVYKFVVETGDWPKAWIQVPGGNSGDPFDRNYERFVQDWADGKMRTVEYYRDLDEAKLKAKRTVELSPEPGAP